MTATIVKSVIRRTICGFSASGGNDNGNGNDGGNSNSCAANANAGDGVDAETDSIVELRLAFLGCEVLPPYGPCEHTAELFADLIASAWLKSLAAAALSSSKATLLLILEVYDISRTRTENESESESESESERFPSGEDLANKFDGVVLPGSFSSAYDEDTLWIRALRKFIQTTLVALEIPTLGVCFGHQLYAHSFSGGPNVNASGFASASGGGMATRCPAGPQAGRKTTTPTPSGKIFLELAKARSKRSLACDECGDDGNNLELFYTHGDMVESLPAQGISLGGNDAVPIHAALYGSSKSLVPTDTILCAGTRNHGFFPNGEGKQVIAVTFQAHPEFACLGGRTKGDETLRKTMELMRDNGDLSDEDFVAALEDVDASSVRVREQSLEAMVAAGRLLGWFGE